jgi:hypothetical protein
VNHEDGISGDYECFSVRSPFFFAPFLVVNGQHAQNGIQCNSAPSLDVGIMGDFAAHAKVVTGSLLHAHTDFQPNLEAIREGFSQQVGTRQSDSATQR